MESRDRYFRRSQMSQGRAVRIAVAFARQAASIPAVRLCGACVDVLDVTGAGITLMSGKNIGPVCSSNERTEQLEDLQFSLGEGPCHDAYSVGRPVSEPDLRNMVADRWPNYAVPALAIGACGVFAFPLHVGSGRIGVLTLYQDQPGRLSVEQNEDSIIVAEVLAKTLLSIQGVKPEILVDELVDDGAHRAEVHQASGIVAIQLGIGVAEALMRIRAYAYAHEQRVAVVATEIVARRLKLDDDTLPDGSNEAPPENSPYL